MDKIRLIHRKLSNLIALKLFEKEHIVKLYNELTDAIAEYDRLNQAEVIKSVCGCGKIGEYSKKFDKVLCDECFDELL